MCGIAGIIDFSSQFDYLENLRNASSMMKNRGPDDSGIWNDNVCGLAQRRLSILDLSNSGHQPMISPNNRFVCTYNGEIYNFKQLKKEIQERNPNLIFKSDTDTEVLLAGWEIYREEFLNMMDGMFAFGIWDRKDEKIYLARDRMGEKPLYYSINDKRLNFSSRPLPMFKLDKNLSKEYDNQGLRYFIESGYVPAPYSIYSSIKKLTPGNLLIFSKKDFQIKNFWNPYQVPTNYNWLKRSENDLIDELDSILEKSIRERMVSDVPVGAFLSGGIDSTLVVANMKKVSSNIKTFTIGFKEKEYDESIFAQEAANNLNTDHFCNYLKVDNLLDLLPKFFESYDEPFFDSAAFPTLAVSKLAKEHVTVSLSGDGGDELFGGYHYYKIIKFLSIFYKSPKVLKSMLSKLIGLVPLHNFQLMSSALCFSDVAGSFSFIRGISKDFNSILSDELFHSTYGLSDMFSESAKNFNHNISASELAMRLDTKYTMNDDYLQKTDLASMAYSLEARAPFLSKDLVEWSFKLPSKFKLASNTNKYLLRKLAYRYVPKQILDRPKRGFGVPIDRWLRDDLKKWSWNIINDPQSYKNLPIKMKSVIDLFNIHQRGSRNSHPLLWATIMMLQFNKNQSHE